MDIILGACFAGKLSFKKLPYLQLEGQLGAAFLLNSKFVDARTINASIGVAADIASWVKESPNKRNNPLVVNLPIAAICL